MSLRQYPSRLVLRVCALGKTQQALEPIILQFLLSSVFPKDDLLDFRVRERSNVQETSETIMC